MQSIHHLRKVWTVVLILVVSGSAIAWIGSGEGRQLPKPAFQTDSVPHVKHVPPKKKKVLVDVDPDIQIEPNLRNLHIELDGFDEKLESVDWDNINREIQRTTDAILDSMTIPEIDLSDIETGIKDIDIEKIEKDVQETVQQAIKSIDLNEIDAEVQTSLNDVNIELRDASGRGDTREERNMATHEKLLVQLEEDGLINSGKNFELEYKDKNFYINGEKQSPITTDRYRKYFRDGHTRLLYKNGRFTSR